MTDAASQPIAGFDGPTISTFSGQFAQIADAKLPAASFDGSVIDSPEAATANIGGYARNSLIIRGHSLISDASLR